MPSKRARASVLYFKPIVPVVTDEQWMLLTRHKGLLFSLSVCFWEWATTLREHGLRENFPSNPTRFFNHVFGKAGIISYAMSDNQPYLFHQEMRSTDWALEELGEFGEWIVKAGVPLYLIPQILHTMLVD